MIVGRFRQWAHWGFAVSRQSILASGGGGAYLIAAAALNASNFVFNVIASRLLGPSAYGALGSLLGLVAVVTIVFGALTVAVARTITAEAEQPRPGDLAPSRLAILVTVLSFVLVLALALPLRNLLHLASVWPVLILSFVLPLAVAEIVPRGALLGRLHFRSLSVALAASAITRLVAGVILLELGMGLNGAVLATVLSQLVVTALIVWPVRHELRRVPETTPIQVPVSDATLALIALGGFSAFNAVDSVLARYYLPAVQSGYYVAASTAAQIAFALPVTIALMAYPRFVAAATEKDGDGRRVLIEGVAVVGTLGFLAAALLSAFPHLVVSVLFGEHYAPAAATLRVLAWEGLALGLISVFIYFHLGHRKLMSCASWVGVAGAIALVAGVFHDGQLPIAFVMVSASFAVLLAMAVQALFGSKTSAQRSLSLPPGEQGASAA
jgi:O-antigen/teichoic acid export membrane protein